MTNSFTILKEEKSLNNDSFTSNRRILLVENDINDVKLTLLAFEKCKLMPKIDVVNDGLEALDYLFARGTHSSREVGNPMFLLLDLKMPKLSGIEVLRKIRSNSELKMIPVIILSSSRQDQDLKDCYQAGSNAYVVKPVDFQIFQKVIMEIAHFWTLINEPPPVI
jgi:CheY-like chemotaxis protein